MLRAADAAIDIEAMRVTWQARLALRHRSRRRRRRTGWPSGRPPSAGSGPCIATQHLHGGMGADITYPIHRYFLWGKQIELLLGGPSAPARPAGRGHRRAGRWPEAEPGASSDRRPADPTLDEVVGGRRAARRWSCPLTRTLIVSGALASRDYQDVHHDSVLAVERGSKDIFMNILTTNGLVGRYVTDWSGPGGGPHEVNIRLGAPNYPDDTMTLTGSVTAEEAASTTTAARRGRGRRPGGQRARATT